MFITSGQHHLDLDRYLIDVVYNVVNSLGSQQPGYNLCIISGSSRRPGHTRERERERERERDREYLTDMLLQASNCLVE